MEDLASIPGRVKPKTLKLVILGFLAGRSAFKKDGVKLPPCVVDRWAGGSLTRKPKSHFAV